MRLSSSIIFCTAIAAFSLVRLAALTSVMPMYTGCPALLSKPANMPCAPRSISFALPSINILYRLVLASPANTDKKFVSINSSVALSLSVAGKANSIRPGSCSLVLGYSTSCTVPPGAAFGAGTVLLNCIFSAAGCNLFSIASVSFSTAANGIVLGKELMAPILPR